MNTFISPRRVVLFLAGLVFVAVALSGCCLFCPHQPVTHTITIKHNGTTAQPFVYSISPPQAHPDKAYVRRGDTVLWVSESGKWEIEFKGDSPIVDQNRSGRIFKVSANSGSTSGGVIDDDVKVGEIFKYDVSVTVPGFPSPVREDPKIIIGK